MEQFKAGDRIRVYFEDGTLDYVEGILCEDRVILDSFSGKYNKLSIEGLFFKAESIVWSENSHVMDRYFSHYCGRYYGLREDKPYTELDGILKNAKKVELISNKEVKR